MQRQALGSGAVLSVGYDVGTQCLELEFPGARVYRYEAVPASVHRWLLRVPDKATFVQRVLTPGFRYRELGVEPAPGDLEGALRASLERLRS